MEGEAGLMRTAERDVIEGRSRGGLEGRPEREEEGDA